MTCQPDFTGCWAKLRRAEEHLVHLRERVQGFVDGNAYGVEPDYDFYAGEVVVYGKALREPPIAEWGVIIGDIVHNLRSALDHLVWQLTLINGRTPPAVIPRGKAGRKWRDIAFPIKLDPTPTDASGNLIPWSQTRPRELWGVGDNLAAHLESLQPFHSGQDPRNPLWVLNELWNIDKHRHVPLTGFFVGVESWVFEPPFPGAPDVQFEVVAVRDMGPFEGRTKVGRVKQVGMPRVTLPQMHVNARVSFDVSFRQGPPAYGARVAQELDYIRTTVEAVLRRFESVVGHLP
jgi:hypothetical protein